MGRIDEALRRSNQDAAQGTGAEAPEPAASPWRVDLPEDRGEVGRDLNLPVSPEPAGAAFEQSAQRDERRPVRWGGFDAGTTERLVVSKNSGPLLVEQFRGLAAALLRAQGERHLKSIIVTSPSPGDGKSHVAVNLALTLSESYRRRVLLVDADLRRPTLHALFRMPNSAGLSELLKTETDGRAAGVQVSQTLRVLPAGGPEASPLGGLSSTRMKRVVASAATRFDWVIVDSPPVGVLADARLVSETVDAAVLVVRAAVTRFQDLEAAIGTLGAERILGVVLNAVDPLEIRSEGYYKYYSGSEAQER
jgi:protein-tyrosine kinase